MTLDWAPTSDTAWAAHDARYTYRVAASSPSPFEGYIYHRIDGAMAFSWTYRSLSEAMADLASRGEREYFVRPDKPTPVVPAEATPPAEKPVGPVLDEDDVLVPPVQEEPIEELSGSGHTIERYVDSSGKFRWRRKASIGRIIADSVQGYSRREHM